MRAGLPGLLVLFLAACNSPAKQADTRAAEEPAPREARFESYLPAGELFKTSRKSSFDDMVEELAEADIVYVGETHTDKEHHLLQLRVIEALWERGRLHAIGMEMFQRRFQPFLVDYVEGRIDEEEFLEKTEYEKRWGYPIELYRPILAFARRKKLPLIALNVENEIRSGVREGGVESLSDEERATLPALDTTNQDHRAFLRESYKRHLPPGKEPDEEKFERFYLIMCLWDDVMADSIVRWFRTAPDDAQMVVLAGSGHLANRYGIPGRTHTRNGRTHRVVVPLTTGEPEQSVFAQRYADFVWLVPAAEE